MQKNIQILINTKALLKLTLKRYSTCFKFITWKHIVLQRASFRLFCNLSKHTVLLEKMQIIVIVKQLSNSKHLLPAALNFNSRFNFMVPKLCLHGLGTHWSPQFVFDQVMKNVSNVIYTENSAENSKENFSMTIQSPKRGLSNSLKHLIHFILDHIKQHWSYWKQNNCKKKSNLLERWLATTRATPMQTSMLVTKTLLPSLQYSSVVFAVKNGTSICRICSTGTHNSYVIN